MIPMEPCSSRVVALYAIFMYINAAHNIVYYTNLKDNLAR